MVFRVFIANATAREVAEIGQAAGVAGTVSEAIGFGSWGIEPTVTVEVGGISTDELSRFVDVLFAAFPAEEAVYVTTAGTTTGEVWWRDGRVE